MRAASRLILAMLLGALCVPALALDYRAAARSSILYDSPSAAGKKLYIVAADTPLEVVVTLEKWIKVRTHDGQLAWIARADLSDHQTVEVTADKAEIRQTPAEDAPVVFAAARNVLLRVTGPAKAGWLPVAHADGETGFARLVDVWGH
ncbi:hypothetical protein G3580_13165 [Nitrogeniibacter mangrovi]|uniref:SH3b domain-containing protein n=1 Tax=Nitrogeniibacter mangrovi TaxID=2016596 RepID=A0A6C1B6R5_9RHOO|nr:SH3 domain-containing protein [Nitrogeniibacter mangrovi]QID18495.1 hypothetical protein G3580_13165 [Nitrogeniibacter mangrovi]